VLAALLVLVFLYLVTAPFFFSGARAMNVAASICVFLVLVASFDLLLGYSGIVSFAHGMFYGMGA
jgi:branched-chain amino acid transport system permease protein